MISANDLRKGMNFEWEGEVYQVVDFQHVKPGKGAAFVRAKLKAVMTGVQREVTLNPNDKFNEARIETKEMQFLYTDGELHYFMDTETYEQVPIEDNKFNEASQYIRENDMALIKFYNGNPFLVEAPNFVELEVTETEPGMRGDTATGATKPATVVTGATLNVPLFINIGDVIKIDTRTHEYLSRV